jgi:DNA-binding response OmpR family regulator
MMHKILLLEDDEILAQTLVDMLESENFIVCLARDGETALDLTYKESFDLYLLDVNVPFLNGFDFLKSLRQSGDKTPAFFLTALKDIDSLSKGFDSGCDDYIKKPFDFNELLVRIKAKLKIKENSLKYKNITYDSNDDEILLNDKPQNIAYIDKKIFFLLLKNEGSIVPKDLILSLLEKPSEVALRGHISKIKKLLSIEITNVRGQGYRLEKL